MKCIVITGAGGFIGRQLCHRLNTRHTVIGVDIAGPPEGIPYSLWEQADVTDGDAAVKMCEQYSPDTIIHCAGIAHQKMGAVGFDTYMRVNSEGTETLAKAAVRVNPNVCFIFFSSISVYGEAHLSRPVSEDSACDPSGAYAESKLDAERRLGALADDGTLHNLIILRLAPVYDRKWSLNLDRRVFAPRKIAYLKFGSGSQRMSAVARPNLVDFVEYLIHRDPQPDAGDGVRNDLCNLLFNVCDTEPYSFVTVIDVFKKSGIYPKRRVIPIPLCLVWLATRFAGIVFRSKRAWIHSCYEKLASDLIFDNTKMLGTGFRPVHSLETVMKEGN